MLDFQTRTKRRATMTATPWDVIQRLHDSQINAGLQTDWEGGLVVWIGDTPDRGFIRETFVRGEFDQVAGWLDTQARRLFPDSDYAMTPPTFLEHTC
jgi:hypothetical protein